VLLAGREQVRDGVPAQRGAAEQTRRRSGRRDGAVGEQPVEPALPAVEGVQLEVELAQLRSQVVLALAQPGALTAAINYYRALFRQGAPGLFHGTGMLVQLPTLMIWGEEDTALGKELTYGTEQFVPDLRIRYIPRCSHWVQQEQPDLVNQYMLEFLSDLRS